MARVREGVQGEEMPGALQVEWVAAGVAVVVEMWVRYETVAMGTQLVITIVCMAMLVFSSGSAHSSSMVRLYAIFMLP